MMPEQKQLETTIQPLIDQIIHHPLFPAITTLEMLARFSEYHVYAVWDFIVLLKSLQDKLAPIQPLWLPPSNYLGCHLVNSMVTEEESDALPDGRYLSHFDLYIEAMQQSGADISAVLQFLADIRKYLPFEQILKQDYIPAAAKQFIHDTFSLLHKPVHITAASFAYAREAITSGMFTPILQQLQHTPQACRFAEYFQRHIDLDGGKHSDQAKLLVGSLCGSDPQKWQEATDTAIFSLNSRLRFLTQIAEQLDAVRTA